MFCTENMTGNLKTCYATIRLGKKYARLEIDYDRISQMISIKLRKIDSTDDIVMDKKVVKILALLIIDSFIDDIIKTMESQ